MPALKRPFTIKHRLLRRMVIDPIRGCWLWVGALGPDGYGKMTHRNNIVLAVHRVAYMEYKGDIPKGMQVDHLCFVRNCFNPEHLEAVTPKENSIRAKARLTHCQNGHPYVSDNIRMDTRGHRVCKSCARNAQRKQREKNRGR